MRPLVKRTMEYKPYNEPNIGKAILLILLAIIGGAIIISFMGCSIEKRNTRILTKASYISPVTSKDSALMLKIAKNVIKPPQPVTISGKTIQVIKNVPVFDNKARKHLMDSLTEAHKDADSISKDQYLIEISDNYNRGWDAGYATGVKTCPDSVPCPPVVCPTDTLLGLNYASLQTNYGLLKSELDKTTAQRDIYQDEAKKRLWLLLIFAAGLLTGGILWVKGKFKPKILVK